MVFLTGLAVGSVGPESVGIDGGSALGHNACLRGSCTLDRRYYLTEDQFAGNQAAAASTCGPGFHMASLFELWDTSGLRYDTERGFTTGDSGEGPPTDVFGWIRTGRFSNNGFQGPGRNNCNAWSTTAGSGTRVNANFVWEDPASTFGPFRVELEGCSTLQKVWCVGD